LQLIGDCSAPREPRRSAVHAEEAEGSEMNGDLVYQSISVELSPGTWRVDAFATLTTTVSPDAVQIGLWDDSSGTEVGGSRSPVATTVSYSAAGGLEGCDGTSVSCSIVMATTSKVMTITEPTTIRLGAFRNGDSRVWIGAHDPNDIVSLPSQNRLVATRLR
jgi:hypothetical protein